MLSLRNRLILRVCRLGYYEVFSVFRIRKDVRLSECFNISLGLSAPNPDILFLS